ncbi:hypothetical protein D3C79_838280 [compost metagenome]
MPPGTSPSRLHSYLAHRPRGGPDAGRTLSRRDLLRAHGQEHSNDTARHPASRSRPDLACAAPRPGRGCPPERARAAVQLAARQRQRGAMGLRLGNPSGAVRQPRLRTHLRPPGQPGAGRLQRVARQHLPRRPGVRRAQPGPGTAQGLGGRPRVPHPQCRRPATLAERQVLHQPATRWRPGDHRRHRRRHHREEAARR